MLLISSRKFKAYQRLIAAGTLKSLIPGLVIRLFFTTFCLVGLAACSSFPVGIRTVDADVAIALEGTPFFPQTLYQCGPAALATILSDSDVEVLPEVLVSQVFIPSKKGSIRPEMIATVRRFERLPYVIDGTLQAILDELKAGRPVLIMQNLGLSWSPRWHYAVVVGYSPVTDEWQLRSGIERVRLTSTRTLLYTWRRADYWALVALHADELPANPDSEKLIRVISGLEQTGHQHTALHAWRTLSAAFPDNALALLGQANAELAENNLHVARDKFRVAVKLDPTLLAARNNLAMTELGLGEMDQALMTIRSAIAVSADSSFATALYETEQEILAAIKAAASESTE